MIPGENALVPGKSIEKCEASWEVLPWGGPSGVTRSVCMMGSFTGVCYDYYSSLHFALLVSQGRALASRILPARQVRHGLKPGSGLYQGCFSAFDILYMDARSLSGSSGYTVAFGRVMVICFLLFPATAGSKIRGTGNFCTSSYQPNPNQHRCFISSK